MALPEPIPNQDSSLTTMAGAVATLKAATHMLQQSLVAVNGLPALVEQQLQEFKAEFATEVTLPLQQRMAQIEAKQRDSILVDPLDKQRIKEAIAKKAREYGGEKIHFSRMYGRLHREFGINSYEFLRKVDLNQALRYIAAYDGQRTTWAA